MPAKALYGGIFNFRAGEGVRGKIDASTLNVPGNPFIKIDTLEWYNAANDQWQKAKHQQVYEVLNKADKAKFTEHLTRAFEQANNEVYPDIRPLKAVANQPKAVKMRNLAWNVAQFEKDYINPMWKSFAEEAQGYQPQKQKINQPKTIRPNSAIKQAEFEAKRLMAMLNETTLGNLDEELLHGIDFEIEEEAEQGLDGISVYEIVTNRILEKMKSGNIPWSKPWFDSPTGMPINFHSKKAYRGINAIILGALADSGNPYFLTLNQIRAKGGELKENATAFPVVFYAKFLSKKEKATDSEGKTIESNVIEELETPIIRYYYVFNSTDIKGIKFPKQKKRKITEFEAIESAEKIVKKMPNRPPIKFGGNQAFYRPSMDYVQMPFKEKFKSPQVYYSTLFHELTHSTKHPNRLGKRDYIEPSKRQFDKEYTKEELVAELGASFLCAESGILFKTLDNSSAYLESYFNRLTRTFKQDSKFIFKAAAMAQKAADYILKRKPQNNQNIKPIASLSGTHTQAEAEALALKLKLMLLEENKGQSISQEIESERPETKNASKEQIIYVDGTDTGCGLYHDGIKLFFPRRSSTTNNDNELLAILIGYKYILHNGYKSAKIYSDSQVAIGIANSGWSKSSHLKGKASLIKKFANWAKEKGFEIELEWIPGIKNLADGPSRGDGEIGWGQDFNNFNINTGLGMACESASEEEIRAAENYAKELQLKNRKILKEKGNPYAPNMPLDLLKELASWPILSKSPYSHSYYNTVCKSWSVTPEGSLRVSDHWNFYSRGTTHCVTDIEPPKNTWCLAEYKNGIYVILKYWENVRYWEFEEPSDFFKEKFDFKAVSATKLKLQRSREKYLSPQDKKIQEQRNAQRIRNQKIEPELQARQALKNHWDKISKVKGFEVDFKKNALGTYYRDKVEMLRYFQLGFKKKPTKEEARKKFIKNEPKVKLIKGVYSGSGSRTKRVGSKEIVGAAENYWRKGTITVRGETGQEFTFEGKKINYMVIILGGFYIEKVDKNKLIYDLCF